MCRVYNYNTTVMGNRSGYMTWGEPVDWRLAALPSRHRPTTRQCPGRRGTRPRSLTASATRKQPHGCSILT